MTFIGRNSWGGASGESVAARRARRIEAARLKAQRDLIDAADDLQLAEARRAREKAAERPSPAGEKA